MAKDIDKFSWRRVVMFSGFYREIMRRQLLFYLIFVPLCTAGYIWLPEMLGDLTYSLMGIGAFICPLTMGLRDDTVVRLAPVKASEKLTFYLLWCLVAIPMFQNILYYGINFAAWCFNPEWNVFERQWGRITEEFVTPVVQTMVIGAGWICSQIFMISALYMVVTRRRHQILSGVLTLLAEYGVIMVLALVFGVIAGIMSIEKGPVDLMRNMHIMILAIFIPVLGFCVGGAILFLRKFYNKLR